jgi:hypothetical protein
MRRAILASLALSTSLGTACLAGGLVMNEYCAVGSTKWLNGGTATVDATGGQAEDLTFGRVLGNGNNWIELVVTEDHLDLRGWKLRWAETLKFTSTGQNIWYGDGLVNQGVITFSSDARWSDLRAGTILTVIEFAAAGGGFDTDFTFDPCAGDWWINVHTKDNAAPISTVTNVAGDAAGNFSVGNDGWLLEVVDAAGQVVTSQCGEGALGYAGGGVSSTETCRLEGDPRLVQDTTMYDDADSSSFGRMNSWGDPINLGCTLTQDFGDLRAPVLADCATCNPIFLNEYNAVASTAFLNGGTLTADDNGGTAADPAFGRTLGNGGNWIELVVAVDSFDMRGLRLEWRENKAGGNSGVVVLRSDVAEFASVPGGTIVTLIERNAADGGRDTDLTVDVAGGDRWMNLCSRDASVIASTTSTRPGSTFGSFTTSSDRWTLTIKDASGAVIAAPAGEGSLGYHRGGVSTTDVCRLEEDPSGRIDASSWYDDTGRLSTFGAPNAWADCPDDGTLHTQDFSAVPACAVACFGDLDGSTEVDQGDIAFALLDYGPCAGCPSDLDGSTEVDFGDVALILLSAGPCS